MLVDVVLFALTMNVNVFKVVGVPDITPATVIGAVPVGCGPEYSVKPVGEALLTSVAKLSE